MTPATSAIESRVESLLSQLTLAEKVSLCHAGSKFAVAAIARLGIPEWGMSDGPHGVRREISRDSWDFAEGVDDEATYLPTGTAMAATWNPEMGRLHGSVLGAEARARGKDIILGPGINLIRSPLCGRNFEYYSEDPYLIAELVVPEIEGIQAQDVAACVKHYACNNQELNRSGVDARPDERTLRELYLPGFEAAVRRAGVLTLMGGYNLIRGQYACHNEHLLNRILKGEWGFRGAVISDWNGAHDMRESALYGLDLEMGTDVPRYEDYFLARQFREALERGELPTSLLDDKVRRNLRVMLTTKVFDPQTRKPGAFNAPAHQQATRAIAREAIVLLKNTGGLLPLSSSVRRLLVVGDNATAKHAPGGFSSGIRAKYEVTPLEGLRAAVGPGVEIIHHHGYPAAADGRDIDPLLLDLADAGAGTRGWTFAYYDNPGCAGTPREISYLEKADLDWRQGRPFAFLKGRACTVRLSTTVTPAVSGIYRLVLSGANCADLRLDRTPLIPRWEAGGSDRVTRDVELVAGRRYHLEMDFRPLDDEARNTMRLTWVAPGETLVDGDEAALLADAKRADAVLFIGGLSHQYDTEGSDRLDMRMHDGQDELIAKIAAANPRIAVVLIAGSPVEMPWLDQVPAVVWGWYGGMEIGHALAEVLTGKVNPSGKLPFTLPKALADSPAHALGDYAADVCNYTEGVFTGYRWFDAKGIEPLFAFGHGLSYTRFAYRDLVVEPGTGDEVARIRCTIENTGSVAGSEVVQLYLGDDQASVPRPPRELKGFAKIALAPGESRSVSFALDRRALSFWDEKSAGWRAEAGRFTVWIGTSSRDLRLTGGFDFAG